MSGVVGWLKVMEVETITVIDAVSRFNQNPCFVGPGRVQMWVTSSCECGMGLQLMIYSSLGTQQRDLGFRER